MRETAFSRKTAIVLALVMGTSLVTFLFLVVFGESEGLEKQATAGHRLGSSFSRSAVGHAAFVALLERLPVAVTVSRFRSGARAGETAVLLLLEPDPGDGEDDIESFEETVEGAYRVLLVLPKRSARRDPVHGWKAELPLTPVPNERIESLLRKVDVDAKIVRPSSLRLTANPLPTPRINAPQLIRSNDLMPIVAGPDGILLGTVRGRTNEVYVLSDPDVLENHGLILGRNAEFGVRALEMAGGGRLRPVVIDETFHGYLVPPRVFSELLRFPLVVAVVHLVLLLGVVYWAGSGRFGAPIEEARGIRAGKDLLIGNMADLLLVGHRTPDALRKYFRNAVAAVSARIGLERELSPGEAVDRLARIGKNRDTKIDLKTLESSVRDLCATARFDEGRVIALARDIHRWRKEFLDGSS